MTSIIFELQPDKLEDELVTLRPIAESDFDALFALAADPLIWEIHPVKDRYKKEVFKEYFDSALASKGAFVVVDRNTGELMGCTRYYALQPELSRVAIGYSFIARRFWGGPYNKAMKTLMLNHAFQYVDSVVLHVGKANIRSQKAVLKLGAKLINEFDFMKTGDLNHFEYEIKKDEWERR
jgi:RimJ/RimL family protein N-acetyltransferase